MLRRKLAMMISVLQEATELVKEFFGYPLTVLKGLQDNLVDYKIYGNSEQASGTPTPSTPIEIKSVGEKTINLFDAQSYTYYSATASADGTITATGTGFGIIFTPSQMKSIFSTTGNYYLSKLYTVGSSTSTDWRIYIGGDSSKVLRLGDNGANVTEEILGWINSATNISRMYTYNTAGTNPVLKLMITTDAIHGTYIPYGYKIPVQAKGINLTNMNDTPATNLESLLAITKPTRCTCNVAGSGSAQVGNPISFTANAKALAIPCTKGSTYSIIRFGTISAPRAMYTEIDSSGNVLYTRIQYATGGDTITTTNDNCAFLLIEWSLDAIDEAQMVIVEGSTIPTEYETYYDITTNIYLNEPLRKVGDNIDYLDFQNGKVNDNCLTTVITGQEADNYWNFGAFATYRQIRFNVAYNYSAGTTYDRLLCTHFEPVNGNAGTYDNKVRLSNLNASSQIIIYLSVDMATTITDVTSWKTWLQAQYSAGNPLIFITSLATTTEETVTLPSIGVNKGITEYTVGTEVKPFANLNIFKSEIEQGTILANGVPDTSTVRIRTKDFTDVLPSTTYTVDTTYTGQGSIVIQAFVFEYTADGTFIQRIPASWTDKPYTFTTSATTGKIKFIFCFSTGGAITPSDVTNTVLVQGSVVSPICDGMYAKAKVSEL